MHDGPGQDVVEIRDTVVSLPNGRRLTVWRTGADTPAQPRRVAIVAPGFARRMRNVAPIARYLVDNGFVVYRCDYLDHVGLSDGDIWEFTLTGMYESLAALHAYVLEAERVAPMIVSASLAARVCFRLAAEKAEISGIAAVVGIVNTRYTLERVFEHDYSAQAPEEYAAEEFASFEGKKIQCRRFTADWRDGTWLDVQDAELDIARAQCPIVNFCGSSDDWIDVAEVKRAFDRGNDSRRVVELPFVEHELSQNPVAAQTIFREVTRCALEFAGAEDSSHIAETPFTSLAAQVPYERNIEATRVEQGRPT